MELLDCTCKGDFMNYCLANDRRIKEIDSAIPMQIATDIRTYTDTSMLVTVYFKSGEVKIMNIMQYSLALELNK